MKRFFLFLPLMALGQLTAIAQTVDIKAAAKAAGVSLPTMTEARQQVKHMLHTAMQLNKAQKATANPERLRALADYDLTLAPGSQLLDSIRLTYSGSRTSTYSFDDLTYDLDNYSDYPPIVGSVSSVQYDSAISIDPSMSGANVLFGRRLYNGSDRVTQFFQSGSGVDDRKLFTYNTAGLLTNYLTLQYNTGTGTWDSSSRDFYTYDANGYLLRDSSESYGGGSWAAGLVSMYTNNSTGYPVVLEAGFSVGPAIVTVFKVTVTYASGSNYSRSIFQVDQGNGLENAGKDTVGYSGNSRNFYDVYNWDTGAHAWVIYSQERRHLNAASQPDSIFSRTNSLGSWDTTYQKLTYNTNGNPTSLQGYAPRIAQPQSESRYYYAPIATGVSNIAPLADIIVYPNPATNSLRISGGTLAATGTWHYQISNISGQVLESASVPSSSAISVNALPAGLYSLTVVDAKSAGHVVRFQKL